MIGLLKGLLRTTLFLLAVVAGCQASSCVPLYGIMPAYGVMPPTENPDPALQLLDFSYEPSSPVADATELTFTVTANKASPAADGVLVDIGENNEQIDFAIRGQLRTYLVDNGYPPDEVADDGVFTGLLQLPSQVGPLDNLSVVARVDWWSSATPPEIYGDPLSILAPDEEE
jgi:hypothetical protein